jgi:hypothetical protein
MVEKKPDKCAHPGCECTVPKGSKYCSDYCESHRQSTFPSPAGAGMRSVCRGNGECRAITWKRPDCGDFCGDPLLLPCGNGVPDRLRQA